MLSEISSYIEKFHAAFSTSNRQEILNLARVRLQEIDKAYPGTDPLQENARFLRNVEKRKQNAHWKVTPQRHTQFDFRVCANGRMVEIINADWKPTIRGGI